MPPELRGEDMNALNLFLGLGKEVQEAEAFSLRLQAIGVPREKADQAYRSLDLARAVLGEVPGPRS